MIIFMVIISLEVKIEKFIPLCVPYFDGKEKEYLNKCVESTFVSTAGKFIELFEENLKLETKSPNVVTVNSGTSALHLSSNGGS